MATENYRIDFTISDETVNRYGYRILTAGIDTARFEANPVAYFNHDTSQPAVGKWVKVWKDEGKLKGTLEFDGDDEFAMKLYKKYKSDFMRAVSLHIIPVEESDAKETLLPGQRYSTVTKCELMEISLVTLPGNANAVKLCSPEGLEFKLNSLNIMTEIEKNKTPEAQPNSAALEELQKQLDAQKTLNAKNLVRLHQQRGVVQEGEIEPLTRLAATDYESVEKMLDARKPAAEKPGEKGGTETTEQKGEKLSAELQDLVKSLGAAAPAGASDERKNWTYYDWYRKDAEGLSLMQKNEPERYKKLETNFNADALKNKLKADEN
ncbi:MAG: HK97 family phage prohead protease [Prevotellaceae bacterium]|nr:HK97 family phage prohead protease [Prevotellaceae bacterium]